MLVFSLIGIKLVMPNTIVDLLPFWNGRLKRHRNGMTWKELSYMDLLNHHLFQKLQLMGMYTLNHLINT
jgi:hypothetical protein